MKYRKKPIIIEAYQLPDNTEALKKAPMWVRLAYSFEQLEYIESHPNNKYWIISTLEGDALAGAGDYLIKGAYDELYPCKEEIFESTYEQVNDDRTEFN